MVQVVERLKRCYKKQSNVCKNYVLKKIVWENIFLANISEHFSKKQTFLRLVEENNS